LAVRAVGQFAPFDVGAGVAVWHLALLGSSRRWAVCAVWHVALLGSSRGFAHPRAPFPRLAPFGSSRPLRAPARAVSAVRAVSGFMFLL